MCLSLLSTVVLAEVEVVYVDPPSLAVDIWQPGWGWARGWWPELVNKRMLLLLTPACCDIIAIIVIGASLSEPHTSHLEVGFSLYIIIMVCSALIVLYWYTTNWPSICTGTPHSAHSMQEEMGERRGVRHIALLKPFPSLPCLGTNYGKTSLSS